MGSAIELQNVGKNFWPGPVAALTDVSLQVKPGEIFTLLGPSGCGKTTALRLIAGFERADAGRISINGRVMDGGGRWVPPEKRGVGMVFQDYALFPHLTVFQNVVFGLNGRRRDNGRRETRARQILSLVGLQDMAHRYPHELSGGQQQRVALARAIAPEPVVVLLDEPFSNLDAHLRHSLRDEVISILKQSKTTCMFVTHDQQDALAVSDRIAVMNRGRVEQVGTPREIYQSPESIFVATFVGRSNLLEAVITGGEGCVLTDFGSFCRVDRSGLPEGTVAIVAVRPDGFTPAGSGSGAFRGRIKRTSYTGSAVEAVVEAQTASGAVRELVIHLSPQAPYGAGDELAFDVVPEFMSVVRSACQLPPFAGQAEAIMTG